MKINIQNKVWNSLLDIVLCMIFFICISNQRSFVLVICCIMYCVIWLLCSMIKMYEDTSYSLSKKRVELDGLYKFLKAIWMMSIVEQTNLYYVFGLALIILIVLDYRNRRIMYQNAVEDMYLDLSDDKEDQSINTAVKYVWMMFFGLICTSLIRDSMYSYVYIVIILLYEVMLTVRLYKEMRNLQRQKIISCFVIFYLIFVTLIILALMNYSGVFLYIIMGGATVPFLNELNRKIK